MGQNRPHPHPYPHPHDVMLREIRAAVEQVLQVEIGTIDGRIVNLEKIEERFDKQIDRVATQFNQTLEAHARLFNSTMQQLVDGQKSAASKVEEQGKKTNALEGEAKVLSRVGTVLGTVFAAIVGILSYAFLNSAAREREKVEAQFVAVNDKVILYSNAVNDKSVLQFNNVKEKFAFQDTQFSELRSRITSVCEPSISRSYRRKKA